MQCFDGGRQVQVTRRWAAERFAARFGADPEATDRAEAFLAEQEIDSGILVRRGHQLKFWHLTVQEYLAAQALAGRQDAERGRLLLGTEPAIYRPEWRELVLLLGGVLYVQGEDKVDGLVGGVLDALGRQPSRVEQARCAGLIGALVRDLAPFAYRPADPRYQEVLGAALAVFNPKQAPSIPLPDRIDAADALAQAGDPRLSWTHPERWVEIPRGRFAMGAQKVDPAASEIPEAGDDEVPVHLVRVDAFRIARFPVTVSKYADFVDDEDSTDPRWWQAGGGAPTPEPADWEAQ